MCDIVWNITMSKKWCLYGIESRKTAVGQSVVYEENKNGEANAVYLSGNEPLVEVLQY